MEACMRTLETIYTTDETTQSQKECLSGVGVTKDWENIQKIVQIQATNVIYFETWVLRPTIKARRSHPCSLPIEPSHVPPPVSTATSDIPTPRRSRKRTRFKKVIASLNAPSVAQALPLKSPARPAKTRTIHNDNPISEILQIVRNEQVDAYTYFDTTDAMDVDVVQANTNTSVKKLMIVVDTNVWIGQKFLIRELLEIDFQVMTGAIKATVIIPWMVLQELDFKIHRKSNNSRFRSGANFIQSLLSENHPQVQGEKASDAAIGNDFNELMADDSILNCAIKCSKLTHVQAVFLTNDVNLLNKAMVNGLAAFKANNELINNLHRCLSANNDNHSTFTCEPEQQTETEEPANHLHAFPPFNSFIASPFHVENSLFTSNSSAQVQECTLLEDMEMDVDDPMGMEVSELRPSEITVSGNEEMSSNLVQVSSSPPFNPPTFEAVATAVQQTLTSIIVPKLIEEYGQEDWKFAIKVKPPFTFESAVKCIHAHWIAVFSYMFSSQSKHVVDQLVKTFYQMSARYSSTEIKAWRLTISHLIFVFLSQNKSISKRPRVVDCCRLLQAYIQFESNNST